MRNLKRALSLAVASVMLLGMMVVGSGAASYSDVTSEHNQEAIDVLQAVGVMTGDDQGDFNPDQLVTRGEMAVIMTNLLDLGIGTYAGAALPFTDVPEWAHAYVAAIYANGITGGTSATTYGTDEPVTAVQAGLMMMKALGYFQYQGDFDNNGGWVLATIRQAARIDLYDGLDVETEQALTRNEVAQLALNTLKANMVDFSGDLGVDVDMGNGQSVTVGFRSEYSYVTRSETSSTDYAGGSAGDPTFGYRQLCEDLYGSDLKLTGTKADDFNRPGKEWTYKGQKVASAVEEPVVVYTAKTKESVVNTDLRSYDYPAGNTTVSNNGFDTASQTMTNASIASLTGNGTVVEVYVDDSNNVSNVVVIESYLAQVIRTSNSSETITVALDTSVGQSITTELGYGDYEVDDYLMVSPKFSNATTIDNSASTKEILAIAPVSEVNNVELTYRNTSDGKATVGGEEYTWAENLAHGTTALGSLSLGNNIDLILDSYGYVVNAEGTTAASGDYIYVYSTYETTSMGENTYYALGVLKDGTVTELEITEDSNKLLMAATYGTPAAATGSDTGIYELYSYTTSSGVATLSCAVATSTPTSNAAFGHTSAGSSVDADDRALNTNHYFANDVTFISVTGSKASDLKATVYTGVQDVATASNIAYVTTKSINNNTNGTISLVFVNGSVTTTSDDIIYVADDTAVGSQRIDGTSYYTYEVYINGEEQEIAIDTAEGNFSGSSDADKFYTYSVDENGVYTLFDYTSKVMSAQNITNLYEGVLTAGSLTNYDISGAEIVDLTDNDVATAGALENLDKTGATVKVAAIYDDDAKTVSMLYITEASATVTGTDASTSMTLSGITASYIDSIEVEVDDGEARTATVSGLTVTLSAAVNTGDEVTLTINTTNGFVVTATATI